MIYLHFANILNESIKESFIQETNSGCYGRVGDMENVTYRLPRTELNYPSCDS